MAAIPDSTTARTKRERWTTIVLREQPDETWFATQSGVSIDGYGETAAAAAARYCQKVDDAGE